MTLGAAEVEVGAPMERGVDVSTRIDDRGKVSIQGLRLHCRIYFEDGGRVLL